MSKNTAEQMKAWSQWFSQWFAYQDADKPEKKKLRKQNNIFVLQRFGYEGPGSPEFLWAEDLEECGEIIVENAGDFEWEFIDPLFSFFPTCEARRLVGNENIGDEYDFDNVLEILKENPEGLAKCISSYSDDDYEGKYLYLEKFRFEEFLGLERLVPKELQDATPEEKGHLVAELLLGAKPKYYIYAFVCSYSVHCRKLCLFPYEKRKDVSKFLFSDGFIEHTESLLEFIEDNLDEARLGSDLYTKFFEAEDRDPKLLKNWFKDFDYFYVKNGYMTSMDLSRGLSIQLHLPAS